MASFLVYSKKGAENLQVEKEPLLKAAIESKLLKPS